MKNTILCVVGTRPEAIKMAPVILALRKSTWANVRVLATAQHREMLDETLAVFGIAPDIDLDIMRTDQTLADLTGRLLVGIDATLASENPDVVLAQGDTTTVLATALACFYRRIAFCHVEAGLRTHDLANPFPEEMNRTFAGRLATLHFAPTQRARSNLLREGVEDQSIHVTGNTVIDALIETAASHHDPRGVNLPQGKRIVLLTAHRRENFGRPLENIFLAVKSLANRHPGLHFVYPVHPNPNVGALARRMLSGIPNIALCEALDYVSLVAVLKRCWLVLTDSGGLQEEGPALCKPVLVLREETERPEAVEAGVARLVGHDTAAIVGEVERLLDSETAYRAMVAGGSPYGDGKAAARIGEILCEWLAVSKRDAHPI